MADDYEALQERILITKQPAKKKLQHVDVDGFADDYKAFMNANKTEREVIRSIVETAEDHGFNDLRDVNELQHGGLYYRNDRNKNLALLRYGGLDEIRGIASHADSPCLHLKPYPLHEKHKLATFKTHYYGGVKKYQWLNIPLSLRGVAYTQDDEKITFTLGEADDEPVFTIPDLLPHLAKEQLKKEAKDVVEGEQLNPIVGSEAIDDEEIEQQIKLRTAEILHDEYGLIEEDLISAELSFVPAGPPRDVGFDHSLITAYGHDDRSSVYTSMRAVLDADASATQLALFYDKEEIGSTGTTGAQNQFWTSLYEDLIELSGTTLRTTQLWERSSVLSADVTSAIDPNFPDAHDETNANRLGYGVAVEKYGGHGGKYGTQDASAEFTTNLLHLFNEHNVPWQTGENGKIDLGGGGTIAKFIAQHGAEVIDIGIPVLGMHAPFELASKDDLYSAYLAYKTFYEG
jgi:aspartyl aminopeptidase